MKLKYLRVTLAILVGGLLLLSFLDFREFLPEQYTKGVTFLQFVPSLMRSIAGAGALCLCLLLLLTFALGRVYCSVLCPLGVLQDVLHRVAFIFRKRNRFRYRSQAIGVSLVILFVTALCLLLGSPLVLNLLDPYSLFGRIATQLFRPLFIVLNNIGSDLLHSVENYSLLFRYEQVLPHVVLIGISILFFSVLAFLVFRSGRLYCNSICPVGTVLRLVASQSVFRIQFQKDRCTKCGSCVRVCKSQCIDLRSQSVDFDRCVACYNCIEVCPEKAISYQPKRYLEKKVSVSTNNSQRNFLKDFGSFLLLTMGIAGWFKTFAKGKQEREHCGKCNEGRGESSENLPLNRSSAVAPPGAKSIARFNDLCTACSLCVGSCPTKVLQPSLLEYGFIGMMQPRMDYESGLCNFDCTICSEVCPNEALVALSVKEKHTLQIGRARFVKGNCIVFTDGTDCGACSEHCPTKAVAMVAYQDGLVIPEVNEATCVGCGACEFACPVRPNRAIFVDGNQEHQKAEEPVRKKAKIESDDDFPF